MYKNKRTKLYLLSKARNIVLEKTLKVLKMSKKHWDSKQNLNVQNLQKANFSNI